MLMMIAINKYFLLFVTLFSLNLYDIAKTYAQNNDKNDLHSGLVYLSNFIVSDRFRVMKENCDNLVLVDTLYLRALDYLNRDTSEALLALTFVTLPYKEILITVPIIDIKITLSIPLVIEIDFEQRRNNLPSEFLIDSPLSADSDKDKLPHFFGSAFLAYNLDFFNFSKFISILIELFEETLRVEGQIDPRDIRINSLGELFGKQLLKNKNIFPSQVLSLNELLFIKYKFL